MALSKNELRIEFTQESLVYFLFSKLKQDKFYSMFSYILSLPGVEKNNEKISIQIDCWFEIEELFPQIISGEKFIENNEVYEWF